MRNIFNLSILNENDEPYTVDKKTFSLYCLILSIMTLASFYFLVLILQYRGSNFFYVGIIVVFILYGLQVYLQFKWTEMTKEAPISEPLQRPQMVIVRKHLNTKWYEFILPTLAIFFVSNPLLNFMLLLLSISRLSLAYRQIIQQQR